MDATLPPDSGAAATATTSLVEGAMLGAYRIERLLGEGAMGEVYLATHIALGRPVALKTLKPTIANGPMLERFFAEARAVNIIRHENIVECTDLVNDPAGRSYIVMELLEGRTLGRAIEDAGRLAPRRAARIVAQVADAIGAAHAKGIVHRDLKPDNVFLIKRAGSADYVKVLDFGIARLRPELGVSATQSGALIGTPAYMSPEQARGEKVGPGADIYALGTILFHMLTGRLPFDAPSLSLMLVAQLQQTPPRIDTIVRDVPRALAELVARALAKTADKRPADMATFRREALAAAGLGTEPGASLFESSPDHAAAVAETMAPLAAIGQSSITASAGELLSARPRRPRWWLAGVASVLAAGAVAATLVATRSRSTPAPASTTGPMSAPDRSAETAAPSTPTPPAPTPPESTPPAPALVSEEPVGLPPASSPKAAHATSTVASPHVNKANAKSGAATKTAGTPTLAAPLAPAADCSLDSFERIYATCSDKAAAKAALQRLNACRASLSDAVDYDVVKRALIRCL